jgi:hypothetical protein
VRGPWAYKGRDFPPRQKETRLRAVGVVVDTNRLVRRGHELGRAQDRLRDRKNSPDPARYVRSTRGDFSLRRFACAASCSAYRIAHGDASMRR